MRTGLDRKNIRDVYFSHSLTVRVFPSFLHSLSLPDRHVKGNIEGYLAAAECALGERNVFSRACSDSINMSVHVLRHVGKCQQHEISEPN